MWKTVALRWRTITRDAFRLRLDRDAFGHAASLAFYTLPSLAPVVIIAVSVTGVVLGEGAAHGQTVAQRQGVMGRDAALAIEQEAAQSRIEEAGLLPTLLGAASLIVGATTVFALSLLFCAMHQVLPGVVLLWRGVVVGALVTAVLFSVGRCRIAVCLTGAATGSSCGAAGSVALTLLWLYSSSLILLFGAAFTRTHLLARGRRVVPRNSAALVRQECVPDASAPRTPRHGSAA